MASAPSQLLFLLGSGGFLADDDTDGFLNACDLCPDLSDPDQEDRDFDLIGDGCDNCPNQENPEQEDQDEDQWGG